MGTHALTIHSLRTNSHHHYYPHTLIIPTPYYYTTRTQFKFSYFTMMLTNTLRNLIAACFLISLALASDNTDGSCRKKWTLTTKKSGWKQKLQKINLLAIDTSTITVAYYPDRKNDGWFGKKTHKYAKQGSMKNEWFSITEVKEVDKENNRINVQIQGMKNRWIYYLEQDGAEFLEHLRTAEGIHGIPEDLMRGSDKVFGFRVSLQKTDNNTLNIFAGMANSIKKFGLQKYFDTISVRVHLDNKNKVARIDMPNYIFDKGMTVTSIDGYQKSRQTLILELVNTSTSFYTGAAADRKLFLGGADPTGEEGKKFLKFLVDHHDSAWKKENCSDTRITALADGTQADWKDTTTTPTSELAQLAGFPDGFPGKISLDNTPAQAARAPSDEYDSPAATDALATDKGLAPTDSANAPQAIAPSDATDTAAIDAPAQVNDPAPATGVAVSGRRRLVGVVYYSFIGFNMFLMCCILVGISFAYHVGIQDANYEPIRM